MTDNETSPKGKEEQKQPVEETSFQAAPAPDLIKQAEAAAARIEAANKRAEELVARNEAAVANRILGGRSEAGQATPEISEEEKKKQGTREFFKGTAVGKILEK